jgi:D-alanyl-D-alanine carboxypeptidase
VRNNKHVIGVVMGGMSAATRDHEMVRILTAAFTQAAQTPDMLADVEVPWHGGKGPANDVFNPNRGDQTVLASLLDPLPAPTPAVKAATRTPAMPVSKPTAPVQVAALKPAGSKPLSSAPVVVAGAAPAAAAVLTNGRTPLVMIQAANVRPMAPDAKALQMAALAAARTPAPEIAEGDIAGPTLTVASSKMASAGSARSWSVQIGAFANATIAQAELAAYAKHALDVVGQAKRLVVPFAGVDGQTLYRARFGLFAENEARDICKKMTTLGQTCFAAQQVN